MESTKMLFTYFIIISAALLPAHSQLTADYYHEKCPLALPTIKLIVEAAIALQPRAGAGLVRMHFHDCFVNGCDASNLLDDTQSFTGEKTAQANANLAQGYELIDSIKAAVNGVCFGNVVSCADILAVAARDSIVALGGKSYEVPLGRKDSKTASKNDAKTMIPNPFSNLPDLIANFQSHGLSPKDLVVLSGAHTIGYAHCLQYKNRLYNETTSINQGFATTLKASCTPTGKDGNQWPLDQTPTCFDTMYYKGLIQNKGLLHSDQQLYQGDGSDTDKLVQFYSENSIAFWDDFGAAMIKMGNISPLVGNDGEIRKNCRVVN